MSQNVHPILLCKGMVSAGRYGVCLAQSLRFTSSLGILCSKWAELKLAKCQEINSSCFCFPCLTEMWREAQLPCYSPWNTRHWKMHINKIKFSHTILVFYLCLQPSIAYKQQQLSITFGDAVPPMCLELPSKSGYMTYQSFNCSINRTHHKRDFEGAHSIWSWSVPPRPCSVSPSLCSPSGYLRVGFTLRSGQVGLRGSRSAGSVGLGLQPHGQDPGGLSVWGRTKVRFQ